MSLYRVGDGVSSSSPIRYQRPLQPCYLRMSFNKLGLRSRLTYPDDRRVNFTYDALGRLKRVTDNNGTGPDSQVDYVYAWSTTGTKKEQTVQEQHNLGGVGPWETKSTYSNIGLRTKLEMPSAVTRDFTYDTLRRLDQIQTSGSTLADYEYKGFYLNQRGLGGAIGSDVVRLSFQQTAALDGYDAWGRTIWMRHYKVTGGTDLVKLEYGYSRGSDRLYQEDKLASTASELYGYDGLHRLASFKRGTLNDDKDGITGTAGREQAWTLDKLGNWANIESKTSGSLVRPYEDRSHNTANEITSIDPLDIGGTNPDSYSPVHDAAGNITDMTADGSPDHEFGLIRLKRTSTREVQVS